MKRGVKTGVCVSCGRWSGRIYRTCPYCGERVWQSAGRRMAAGAVAVVPPLSVALLLGLARPDWASGVRSIAAFPAWAAALFASGAGLLALPCDDSDLVVNSLAERLRWLALAFGGALFCGGVAVATVFALRFGRPPRLGAWVLAGAAWAGALSVPFFYRVPWRALVGAVLLALAVAWG